MTLANIAGLYDQSSTWFHLPPFGPISVTTDGDMEYVERPVPGSVKNIPVNRRRGTTIHVSGSYKETTAQEGLVWQDALEVFLRSASTGDPNTVDIQSWYDSTGTVKRTWRDCQVIGSVQLGDSNTEKRRPFSFDLYTSNIAAVASATGSAVLSSSDYDGYYYSTSEVHVVAHKLTLDVVYPGGLSAEALTTYIDDWERTLSQFLSNRRRVVGVSMYADEGFGTSGSTTFRVSTTGNASAGSGLDVTMAYDALEATRVTGSVDFAAAAPIYIYPTAQAEHRAIHIVIEVEILS